LSPEGAAVLAFLQERLKKQAEPGISHGAAARRRAAAG